MTENTPNNCTECENKKYCWGYYGGLTCKHREEIARQYIQRKEKETKSR